MDLRSNVRRMFAKSGYDVRRITGEPLIENTHSDMSSMLEPGPEAWGEIKGRVPVEIKTLDDYAADNGIGCIDILKSDTQGFDLEVLKGAHGLIG